MTVTVFTPTEDEVRFGMPLGRRLREFNYRHVGAYPEAQVIWLNAKDEDGTTLGGLRGIVILYWLRVELLWVEGPSRRRGVGASLLSEAEGKACELGARNAGIETFEWQAPDFYRKQGYTEASRTENYIAGQYLSFMRKTL